MSRASWAWSGPGRAPAHAYLYPGTGSMILQVLLGGAAGVAFAGRLYWRQFLVMIGADRDPPLPAPRNSRPPNRSPGPSGDG